MMVERGIHGSAEVLCAQGVQASSSYTHVSYYLVLILCKISLVHAAIPCSSLQDILICNFRRVSNGVIGVLSNYQPYIYT